jgi:hypothetical protein
MDNENGGRGEKGKGERVKGKSSFLPLLLRFPLPLSPLPFFPVPPSSFWLCLKPFRSHLRTLTIENHTLTKELRGSKYYGYVAYT